MDQNQVWAALRNRYYNDWVGSDRSTWDVIQIKLGMIDDLREELRKMVNSGDIDNAGSPSAE